MQFQPSSHSYGDAATAAANPSAPSTDATAEVTRMAADLFAKGIDSWRAKEAADPDLARYKAAARKKGKGKKRGGKKPPAFPSAAAASPTTAIAPVEGAGMNPWLKWGLIAGGGALVLFLAWKAFGSKKDDEDIDDRPRRRNPAPRKVTRTIQRVRPAPASSASMFRDVPTEEVIEEVVEQAHGDAYEDNPGEFDYGDGGEE